jgi:hypothetical protein
MLGESYLLGLQTLGAIFYDKRNTGPFVEAAVT